MRICEGLRRVSFLVYLDDDDDDDDESKLMC